MIPKGRIVEYDPSKIQSLEELCKDFNPPVRKEFMFFSGLQTMAMFDLYAHLKFAEIKKWWIYSPKRNSGKYFIEVSLFNKAGLYKVRVYPNESFGYHLYYGTKLICKSDSFNDFKKYDTCTT